MDGKSVLVVVVVLAAAVAGGILLSTSDRKRPPTPPSNGNPPGKLPTTGPKVRMPRRPAPPSDPREYLRWAVEWSAYGDDALEAGGLLGDDDARKLLAFGLTRDEDEYDDEDLAIRALHVKAVLGDHDGLVKLIRDCLEENDYDFIGEWAAPALAYIPGEDSTKLLLHLATIDEWEARSEAAIALAARPGELSLDGIRGLLTDEDDEVKAAAAGALLAHGDANATKAVQAVLDEDDEEMDVYLARGLGVPGNSAALPWLEILAQRDGSDSRAAAARALGATKEAAAVPLLEKLLDDPELEVKAVAAAALAVHFGRADTSKVLIEALRAKPLKALAYTELRIELLRALATLDRREDADLFREVFEESVPEGTKERAKQAMEPVRAWAAHGLLKVGEK